MYYHSKNFVSNRKIYLFHVVEATIVRLYYICVINAVNRIYKAYYNQYCFAIKKTKYSEVTFIFSKIFSNKKDLKAV